MITNKIKKYLDDKHIYNVVEHSDIDGIDNISCCVNSKFIFIEVQNNNRWDGVVQRLQIQQIRQDGGVAFSTTNLHYVKLRVLTLIYNSPFTGVITDNEFRNLSWYKAFKFNLINRIKQDIDLSGHEVDDIFSTRLTKFKVGDILKEAFPWDKTDEGYAFWNNIHTKYNYVFKE